MRGFVRLSGEERSVVEEACPRLYYWLGEECAWLDPDVLSYLRSAGFDSAAEDVGAALNLVESTGDERHNKLTAKIRKLAGEEEDLTNLIMEAGIIRKFLG